MTMTRYSPKPIIAHTHQTWRVTPGMTFALVEDMEGYLWIVESCPAGTHFWTLSQAEQLPQGARTRQALQEALRAGAVLAQKHSCRKAPVKCVREHSMTAHDLSTRDALPLARRRKTARNRQFVETGKALVAV